MVRSIGVDEKVGKLQQNYEERMLAQPADNAIDEEEAKKEEESDMMLKMSEKIKALDAAKEEMRVLEAERAKKFDRAQRELKMNQTERRRAEAEATRRREAKQRAKEEAELEAAVGLSDGKLSLASIDPCTGGLLSVGNLWNAFIAGAPDSGCDGLFTFARPADNMWQIIGLYIFVALFCSAC